MKTIFEHIEYVKSKPHHVRKNIAFTTAVAGTTLVALVWLVGNVSSGTFALKETSFADIAGQAGVEVGAPHTNQQNVAGAAAALPSSNAKARIEIVDTASSTRPVKKVEQTTIPF